MFFGCGKAVVCGGFTGGTGAGFPGVAAISPAVFARGEALSQVWVFIAAPLIGAVLAAVIFKKLFYAK